jgi:hypothetical protein
VIRARRQLRLEPRTRCRPVTGWRFSALPGFIWLLALAGTPFSSHADTNDIAASPVIDVAVTVYRNPNHPDEIDLDDLGGFAFITETRTVTIPAGESRIRFEGVADGIEPASAIVTGLPAGLIEKNHDAKVLSPAALVAATVGHPVTWVRENPKTGQVTRVPGTLLSDANGVVFQAATGEIEALRCSGLPETFDFEPTAAINATPTLSALVRTSKPVRAQVRLSYLARGFDWMAHYSAVVAPDGKTMSLGAWVTLANSNSVSFANAHAKVVAGQVNRQNDQVEPIDWGQPILARCWPRGSTSDPVLVRMMPRPQAPVFMRAMAAAPVDDVALEETVVTGSKVVKEEQLGDLKLYRVPDRTSVVSRQIKQVRLMDRTDIPVEVLYRATVDAGDNPADIAVTKFLRTKNTTANHLGLALPSGHVSTFALQEGTPLLLNEAPFADTTVNETVELGLGDSADVHLSNVLEEPQDNDSDNPDKAPPADKLRNLHRVPGVRNFRSLRLSGECRVEVSNARANPVNVEVSLRLPEAEGIQVVRADPIPTLKDGLPTFKVTVPANGRYTIHLQFGGPPGALE